MPAHRLALSAAIAACFATAVIPDATNAQSRGQGGTPSPAPLATTPGTNTGAQTSPSPQTTVTTPPPSAIGTPAQPQPPVAPLSPQAETTTPSGGGSARTDKSASTTTSGTTTSAGQPASSTPGGGGKTLQDCMGFWDKATHMTKQQWRDACLRVQSRLEGLKQ
jgi:hypothetical protein